MKKSKKPIAVLLSVSILLFFTACSQETKDFLKYGWDGVIDSTGETVTSSEGEEETNAEGQVVEVVTDASGEAVTNASGEAVTKVASHSSSGSSAGSNSSKGNSSSGNSSTTTKASGSSVKSYTTVSEILAFYKASANPLKSSSTASATRTKEVITTISGEIPSTYQTFGFKEGTDTEQVKVGAGQSDSMKSKFPVEGESFVCNLSDSDVASASCTYSGGNYTVTITVKDDDAGTYSRSKKCVSVISIPIGTWTCKGVKVKATINSSGQLTALYYSMPTYVTSGSNSFAFNLEQYWTVNSQ